MLRTMPRWEEEEQQKVLRSHHSLHCACALFQALSRVLKTLSMGAGPSPLLPTRRGGSKAVWDERLQKPHSELPGSLWEHLPISPFKPAECLPWLLDPLSSNPWWEPWALA